MFLFRRKRQKKAGRKAEAKEIPSKALEEIETNRLTESIETTIQFMKEMLAGSDDFVVKQFRIFGRFHAVLFYFSNITDQDRINNEILKPLMYVPEHLLQREISKQELVTVLMEETLFDSQTKREHRLDQLVNVILRGETVIIIEGIDEAIHIGTRKVEKRSIKSPETEQAILGPRESYIESITTNIALIRARLPTPDLCIKKMEIGRLTKSVVAICYLKGIAEDKVIKEVEKRLSEIDIDAVLDIGYIEQFVEDNPFSPFPQTQSTERPDKTVANLAEGRVAILVDGSPFALIVPVVFNQFYQTFDDYSSRFLMGSFARLARMQALVFSLIFPSLYVSFISFNPELLPTEFAVAVAGGRAGVPYPAVVEVLIIEVAMEVLREATVRMPKQVGGALSIVGVLVVGEAAVNAGLASPITVVVIALTSIGSFATPAYVAAFALRMLRFPILILAGIFGLYGVVVGIIFIFNHMLSLKSFGVPYMSPVSPGNAQGLKDVIIRSPLWWMPKRPVFLQPTNRDRLGEVKNKVLQHNKVGNDQREEAKSGGFKRGHNGSSGDNLN
ncbi:spore germination protein [Niallia endozanthoxylica]|uniref:Spore germination protein n=1 Tax=Niallia endozanthoxylica TaxID=2036016 RepID=A0A5J5HQS6_9BACI|nr:spore germination protein [Niallia endozanthoxylica]KAA9024231.1 spore germination protein [Niallia endozanthoxylica]